MKVALVYDRINKWGGAERVLLALHELFPDAPLFTSVHNKKKAKWIRDLSITPSFLQDFPFAKDAHELYPLLMPAAFEQFNLDDFDVVISVTSESAKGIITKPHTIHICYCLTPTRYLWSGYEEYFNKKIIRFLSYPATWYLRKWDKIASKRPDVFVAISEEVNRRIKTYYQLESEIIHPPVDLFLHRQQKKIVEKKNYFLVVSRLVSYKRIDIAIDSCNELKIPLKIVGVGSQYHALRKKAGPTIEFLGEVSDEKLRLLYEEAQALLFPGFEDFGIVMVEALGHGTPVIAYSKGGAKDIITHKKSGILFSEQTSRSLSQAIREFKKSNFKRSDLYKDAFRFKKGIFLKKILKLVNDRLQNSSKRL